MKIGVCIKQVPAREAEVALDTDGHWIAEPETYDSAEPDTFSLEAALQLREQHGSEVVANLL